MSNITKLSPRPGATGCVAPVHPAERARIIEAYQAGTVHFHEGLPPKAPANVRGHAGAEAAYLEGWTKEAVAAQHMLKKAEYLWIRRGDIAATLARADAALSAISWVDTRLPDATRDRMRDAAARVRSLRNALGTAEIAGRRRRKDDRPTTREDREEHDLALLDEADETT